jgi:hypothetical protein
MPIRAFYTFDGACFVHFPTSFVPVSSTVVSTSPQGTPTLGVYPNGVAIKVRYENYHPARGCSRINDGSFHPDLLNGVFARHGGGNDPYDSLPVDVYTTGQYIP